MDFGKVAKYPRGHSPHTYRHHHFKTGNQDAKKERLAPEAHAKRMQCLFQTWATNQRRHKGEVFVSKDAKRVKEKRRRYRLSVTVAKEAREIQDTARRHSAAALRRIAEIAEHSQNDTAALSAAVALLDRAYGKTAQTNTNINVDANGKHTDISGKELDTRIEAALKRVEELTRGEAKAPKSKDKPADIRIVDRDPDSPTQH